MRPLNRNRLMALGVVLICVVVTWLYVGHYSFPARAFGMMILICSIYFSRRFRVRNARIAVNDGIDWPAPTSIKRISVPMWIGGCLLVVVTGITFWLLYQDALHGYAKVGPVYAFGLVICIGAVYWGYLVSKLLK